MKTEQRPWPYEYPRVAHKKHFRGRNTGALLFLGALWFTLACGVLEKAPSTPDATWEAQRTARSAQLAATKMAAGTEAAAMNDAILATVSVKSTARAQELSIKLTEMSTELKITPSGSEGVSWVTCWLPTMAGATEAEKSLQWSFSQSGFGWIGTEGWQEIVSEIHLGTAGEQKLLLSEGIATYGNPSSVVKKSCHGGLLSSASCIYSIVYMDRGMELDIGIHDYQKVGVQADTEISTIYFYSPTGARLDGSGIVWSGYGQYDFSDR
jgi:hypothetical protein